MSYFGDAFENNCTNYTGEPYRRRVVSKFATTAGIIALCLQSTMHEAAQAADEARGVARRESQAAKVIPQTSRCTWNLAFLLLNYFEGSGCSIAHYCQAVLRTEDRCCCCCRLWKLRRTCYLRSWSARMQSFRNASRRSAISLHSFAMSATTTTPRAHPLCEDSLASAMFHASIDEYRAAAKSNA